MSVDVNFASAVALSTSQKTSSATITHYIVDENGVLQVGFSTGDRIKGPASQALLDALKSEALSLASQALGVAVTEKPKT